MLPICNMYIFTTLRLFLEFRVSDRSIHWMLSWGHGVTRIFPETYILVTTYIYIYIYIYLGYSQNTKITFRSVWPCNDSSMSNSLFKARILLKLCFTHFFIIVAQGYTDSHNI